MSTISKVVIWATSLSSDDFDRIKANNISTSNESNTILKKSLDSVINDIEQEKRRARAKW